MSDRILGIMAMLVGGAMGLAAWDYAAPVEYEPVGPRAFPLLLTVLMTGCGAWLAARPGPAASFGRGSYLPKVTWCVAAILIYALLFQLLGFMLATFVMTLPVGRVFGGSWRQCALAGAGMSVVLYLLFDKLLDVVLPWGVLQPVVTQVGL
ncbi:tripartite tricarboxylate transporter TctB family protein [Noviherbaspirillum saxi]|uniref:Tripartite tricarboxylate transporter TctB family protein n=1 Tax=Noviherbaspirillum saxi TaxID=2320863 RepID=A0A3A3FJ03_9BURK|nr:tripartite tricarboxylate transporter TctB family protein [Noviherbaspirillum saxi]RJF92524.1 tripartite tricarboxylate transporter TctB family protein [Noviherbaspirillum saxi]